MTEPMLSLRSGDSVVKCEAVDSGVDVTVEMGMFQKTLFVPAAEVMRLYGWLGGVIGRTHRSTPKIETHRFAGHALEGCEFLKGTHQHVATSVPGVFLCTHDPDFLSEWDSAGLEAAQIQECPRCHGPNDHGDECVAALRG